MLNPPFQELLQLPGQLLELQQRLLDNSSAIKNAPTETELYKPVYLPNLCSSLASQLILILNYNNNETLPEILTHTSARKMASELNSFIHVYVDLMPSSNTVVLNNLIRHSEPIYFLSWLR